MNSNLNYVIRFCRSGEIKHIMESEEKDLTQSFLVHPQMLETQFEFEPGFKLVHFFKVLKANPQILLSFPMFKAAGYMEQYEKQISKMKLMPSDQIIYIQKGIFRRFTFSNKYDLIMNQYIADENLTPTKKEMSLQLNELEDLLPLEIEVSDEMKFHYNILNEDEDEEPTDFSYNPNNISTLIDSLYIQIEPNITALECFQQIIDQLQLYGDIDNRRRVRGMLDSIKVVQKEEPIE